MPNHHHLLVETEPVMRGRGMLMLNGSYARYFNWRYEAEGHVFERKYHCEPVVRDEHFLQAFRYIVLNPVEASLCNRPEEWPWSSFAATAGTAASPPWLDVTYVRELFEPYGGFAYFCNQIASAI
jgi:putative transposase